MIDAEEYREIKKRVLDGHWDEVAWAENIQPVANADDFVGEYIWVVIHAGLAHKVARKIEARVRDAIKSNEPLITAFKNVSKCKAIALVYNNREIYFQEYVAASDKLAYLKSLPWIGEVTKWHLAKNFGLDVIKPDRHLVRIAKNHGLDPFKLCQDLQRATGEKLAVIDQVLWRAGEMGII